MKPVLSRVLSVILPTEEETSLLRACLHSGESSRRAWETWQRQVGSPLHALLEDRGSIRRLRPLLLMALRRERLAADPALLSHLRTAYLKEELRARTYRRICRDVLGALSALGIPSVVLKGAALAYSAYPDPGLRHCHDIDLLLGHDDVARAACVLSSSGFRPVPGNVPPSPEHLRLEHSSRLALELHSHPFRLVFPRVSVGDLWLRTMRHSVAGVPAHVLSPADNLLHVCGHAAYSASRESLRWVCDSWFLIAHYPDLDWDVLVSSAVRGQLALTLSVTLGYLAEALGAPIPTTVRSALDTAAAQTDTIGRELALFGARAGTRGSFRRLLRLSRDWRTRAVVLKWMLLPSPRSLRCVEQIQTPWELPGLYLRRPLRYTYRRLRWLRARVRHGHGGKGSSAPGTDGGDSPTRTPQW